MNLLDENILESQRQLLRSWHIPVRQIGPDLGHKGMADEEIIPFLLKLSRPTLFPRDLGFYDRSNCHARYGLVCLAVGQCEAAHFIRRVLRHRELDTQAKRLGAVVRAMDTGLVVCRLGVEGERRLPWEQSPGSRS